MFACWQHLNGHWNILTTKKKHTHARALGLNSKNIYMFGRKRWSVSLFFFLSISVFWLLTFTIKTIEARGVLLLSVLKTKNSISLFLVVFFLLKKVLLLCAPTNPDSIANRSHIWLTQYSMIQQIILLDQDQQIHTRCIYQFNAKIRTPI